MYNINSGSLVSRMCGRIYERTRASSQGFNGQRIKSIYRRKAILGLAVSKNLNSTVIFFIFLNVLRFLSASFQKMILSSQGCT
jgi:hypothetical protein